MSRETRVRSAKRRRQLGIGAMVIAVAGLMVPAAAFAKGPSKAKGTVETTEICHVSGADGTWESPYFGSNFQFGRTMTVAVDSLDAHLGHGDGPLAKTASANPIMFENAKAAGVHKKADCAFPIDS